MSEPTQTIAVRVTQEIKEEISQVAKAKGQTNSDWIRDQMMAALVGSTGEESHDATPAATTESILSALNDLQARLQAVESIIQQNVAVIKTTIETATARHHRELCTLGQLLLELDELKDGEIRDSRNALLDALERIKASQRSHKETLLQAIAQMRVPSPRRY